MYIQESLVQNETIEEIFALNWTNYIKGYTYLVLAPLITYGIFHVIKQPIMSLTFVTVLAPVMMLILPFFLTLKNIEQGVTNRRVIKKEGIFSRSTNEIRLEAIQTVQIEQSFIGRVFGYGNVMITGRGAGEFVFENIDNPIGVKRAIENAAEKREINSYRQNEEEI